MSMMMPQAPPGPDPRSALLAALGGAAGPSGPPPDQGGDQGADPLEALQSVIQDLHSLIAVLPDGQGTATASQCLAALTRLQSQMMTTGQQAQNTYGTA